MSKDGKYFETNDNTRLYYEDRGQGFPVILIHGWSGSSRSFDHNIEKLSETMRVIRYDQRGHGLSEATEHGARVSRLSMDLQNLLTHLQIKRVALIGCSLGCAVIWNFIELFGMTQIAATIFVDQSPYQLYTSDGTWKLGANGLFSYSALIQFCSNLQHNPETAHRNTVQACLTRSPTAQDYSFFVDESMKASVDFLSRLMFDHNNNDWRNALKLVTCRSLVIVGGATKVFAKEGVAYSAKIMPQAELITFENGSHWMYYEEPDRFNQVVCDFLSFLIE